MEGERPDLVEPVLPPEDASFEMKGRHSIFLRQPARVPAVGEGHRPCGARRPGTEQCILYSALDAYVRRLKVSVPRDGVAHIHEHLARAALELMEVNMRAELAPSMECTIRADAGVGAP